MFLIWRFKIDSIDQNRVLNHYRDIETTAICESKQDHELSCCIIVPLGLRTPSSTAALSPGTALTKTTYEGYLIVGWRDCIADICWPPSYMMPNPSAQEPHPPCVFKIRPLSSRFKVFRLLCLLGDIALDKGVVLQGIHASRIDASAVKFFFRGAKCQAEKIWDISDVWSFLRDITRYYEILRDITRTTSTYVWFQDVSRIFKALWLWL